MITQLIESMYFLIAIFTLIPQMSITNRQNYECHDEYSCVGTSITTSSDRDIECFGYHSCDSASLWTGGIIKCYGGYSCFNASSLIATGSNALGIQCLGVYSCANSDYIYSSNVYADVHCNGEKSCFQSIIYQDSTVQQI